MRGNEALVRWWGLSRGIVRPGWELKVPLEGVGMAWIGSGGAWKGLMRPGYGLRIPLEGW